MMVTMLGVGVSCTGADGVLLGEDVAVELLDGSLLDGAGIAVVVAVTLSVTVAGAFVT